MKLLFLISIYILFTLSNAADSLAIETRYSIVELSTPQKIVYDDGLYRNVFSAFTIYDKNENKILSSGEVYDLPAKVKLLPGTYKVTYTNSKGKLVTEDIEIKEVSFYKIELE